MAVGKNEDFEDFGCRSLCYWHSRFSEIRFDLLDLCEDGLHFSLIV